MFDLKSFNRMVGVHFRDIRVKKRMTQENLADKTGLSRATIASLESGRQAMSMFHLTQMVLGLELENLDSLYKFVKKAASVNSTGFISHAKLTKKEENQMQKLMAKFEIRQNTDA